MKPCPPMDPKTETKFPLCTATDSRCGGHTISLHRLCLVQRRIIMGRTNSIVVPTPSQGCISMLCNRSNKIISAPPPPSTEEDVYGSYSRLLMKYFLSEGIMCGHTLLLASANERTEDILRVNCVIELRG